MNCDQAFAACHARRADSSRSPFDGRSEKSPRNAFNAYFSASISRRVRTPLRRKIGIGGHQPWIACWNKNGNTMHGTAKNFLFTSRPSTVPVNARAEAFASSQRSISHSSSNASMRRVIACSGSPAAWATRRLASLSISLFTFVAVCACTRSLRFIQQMNRAQKPFCA